MKEIRYIQIDSVQGAPKQFQKKEIVHLVGYLDAHIKDRYVLINTILGLDIFYDVEPKELSQISEGLGVVIQDISKQHPLKLKKANLREKVLSILLLKLESYRKNPQLFYLYVKNYIRRTNVNDLNLEFKEKLAAFLDYALLEISLREDIPHYEQILNEKEKYSDCKLSLSTSSFTREVLLKKQHFN